MRAQVAGRLAPVALAFTSLWVSFVCAAFLLFAYLAPRTGWVSEGGRRGNKLSVLPDPNAWNVLVTLVGIAALAALTVGMWSRRWAVAAVLAAAAAFGFGFGAYAAGGYWLGLFGTTPPPDGRSPLGAGWVFLPTSAPPALHGTDWGFRPTSAPPAFAIAALLGVLAALTLAAP